MSESEDMDYAPATEDDSDDDSNDAFFESLLAQAVDQDGEEDDEGDDGPSAEIEIEIQQAGDEPGAVIETERTNRQRRQVLRLIANSVIGRLFHIEDDEDFDDEDLEDAGLNENFHPMWRRRRRRTRPDPNRFPKVPSDAGTELMNSGTFGSNEGQPVKMGDRNNLTRKKLARRILDRELATESYAKQKVNQRLMAQGMIPSSNADMIIHYRQPVYSGQFSNDGNFFVSVNQDFKVRMYDTSNPYKWRYYKTVEYPFGQWTLTDATLSPDNKYLAYTSIRSSVCLAPTDPNDMGDPYVLDLLDLGNRRTNGEEYHPRQNEPFGIWSVRFSGDGRELVAGTIGGSIVVYDIESRRTLHRIFGHDDDVNAVCFADTSSPHILYSGSDDTTLKVWDTRSMGDGRAAGAFVGHVEGLTYIDSKGDGRYILSNGKDQSMKLWDLRMVMSPRDFSALKPSRRADQPQFDYRFGAYDEDDWYVHPNDNSVVTFRGHRVLRTLIRCHFSPPGSTNSRYVYSGSEDGKVYVWNMDATLAGTVDVHASAKEYRREMSQFVGMELSNETQWKTCVRDASWHPNAPIIAASAWSGYRMSSGTCTVHSWNDGAEEDEAEPKMGQMVNQKLDVDSTLFAGGFARLRF